MTMEMDLRKTKPYDNKLSALSFQQDEQMHRISGGGDELEFLIEAFGLIILSMNGEGADASNVRRLNGALHGVAQESLSDALALRAIINRQARKQHNRHRMAGEALGKTFGRFFSGDLPNSKGVIADNGTTHQADISLCRSRLLVGPGESQQIAVEFLPAAVKTLNLVIG